MYKKIFLTLLLLYYSLSSTAVSYAATKVACLGDSITYGHRVGPEENYVYKLQMLLGDDYEVKNFGVNNASVEHGSTLCYTDTEEYKKALEYNADIYLLMIGTNDAKAVNFNGKASFISDYMGIVNKVGRKRIIISDIPPVNYSSSVVLTSEYTTPQNVTHINELISLIALQNRIPLVQNNHVLSDKLNSSIHKDGVHLMPSGHQIVAQNMYKTIVNSALVQKNKKV